ncbi:AMP-dependent synthetase and ligase [Desulfovibrio sp. X2]|uniref:phenylacetate--CoA ligase family protein n=1 Tax=Desulfovibrio sp. X2 TaxID=941449 RepID=UPI000358AA0E|nr:phenylacetate--CoA ligase [Desulfovibrio sp. X2]EPR37427.1 AMP-dependent synthetase and ligase [Desulfovibrio sp. X2]
MFYDPAEGLSRDELDRLQTERLRAVVARAATSPFYAARFEECGLTPDDITCPADIAKVPLTTKQDLRSNYPYGLLTVPVDDLVRLHASSGTTGSPTAIFYTRKDLATWASLMARCMHMCGMRPSDVFQNMSGYGLFTGGLGIHYGAETLGCLTIPAGAGNSRRQIKLIRDFSVTAVHIIPSYALHFADFLQAEGIEPASLPIRIALIGAEPHTEETRRRIEGLFGCKAFNSYGLSEMNGPGVAFECPEQSGMHLWEDAYIVEILNPQTLEPVAVGEIGELVLTTLTREGMPILRYRTRDLTRFLPGECPCGRVHRRIDRIAGRSDDMLIIKGVNIYPMQVEQILMGLPEVGGNYLIELSRDGHMDQFTVKVEITDEFFVEDMRGLNALRGRIVAKLRDELLITPRVELVQHGSLPVSEGKAVRVNDLRPKE